MLRVTTLVLALLAFAAACAEETEEQPAPTSRPPATLGMWQPQLFARHMRLAEAREYLQSLGLAAGTLTSANYECIQMGCPHEAPPEDSSGCLRVFPTGDPSRTDVPPPSDPPGWYSVIWNGASGETYGAPPEAVAETPARQFDPGVEFPCGGEVSHLMTKADAAGFVGSIGLKEAWESAPVEQSLCAEELAAWPDFEEGTGCLSFFPIGIPPLAPAGRQTGVESAVIWLNSNGETHRVADPITITSELVSEMPGTPCQFPEKREQPYPYIPFTHIVDQTEWRLLAPPDGRELRLRLPVGGSCDSFERIDVQEEHDRVTIAAFVRREMPGPNHGCDLSLSWEDKTVLLREPLGDRALYGCDPRVRPHTYFDEHVAEGECAAAVIP